MIFRVYPVMDNPILQTGFVNIQRLGQKYFKTKKSITHINQEEKKLLQTYKKS